MSEETSRSQLIAPDVKLVRNLTIDEGSKISNRRFFCEERFVTLINDRLPSAATATATPKAAADWSRQQTLVKRGASIGSSATVLDGINIRENATIGAGSVVTSDVPANATVAGSPARVVGQNHRQ